MIFKKLDILATQKKFITGNFTAPNAAETEALTALQQSNWIQNTPGLALACTGEGNPLFTYGFLPQNL
jgi:hypothetical protein